MTQEQKQLILEAWDYCDEEDKSTEFMLTYMSDVSGIDYEDIIEYIVSDESVEDRNKYFSKQNNL